ncbi:MAG: sulfite exporter TauE/SafE family protein [Bacteroidales bacterium]|nr:sulfite exporter TauE/SafE family protein [Bacteroidales bacterium]
MGIETIILLLFASTCASVVQRVSGFGFGIFVMTMLPYIMPTYPEATALSALLAGTLSIMVVVQLWRHINLKHLLPILSVFFVTSWIAIQFLEYIDEKIMKIIFGSVLIILSVYFFIISDKVRVKPLLWIQAVLGSVSGLMGGFFNMQGPPAVLYFVASEKNKDNYMAVTQAYFLAGNLFMTVVRYFKGYLTEAVGMGYLYGLGGVVIGFFVGKVIFDRVSHDLLRKLIYGFMAVSGVYSLIVALTE